MFDFPKALSAVNDMDSRLEQIANQQKITNGLLALLTLATADSATVLQGSDRVGGVGHMITPSERAALIMLVRTAFRDTTRLVNEDAVTDHDDGETVRE